jgi:transcriptional regulator with XRE-family HTH domain
MVDSTTEQFLKSIAFLQEKGIVKSARQVAKLLGISASLISEAKRGDSNINAIHLKKLSDLYSKELYHNALFTTDNEPNPNYMTNEETITLPKIAYDAMVYKLRDLEFRLSLMDNEKQKERPASSG